MRRAWGREKEGEQKREQVGLALYKKKRNETSAPCRAPACGLLPSASKANHQKAMHKRKPIHWSPWQASVPCEHSPGSSTPGHFWEG